MMTGIAKHYTGRGVVKFRESGAAPCRGYGSACLEDVGIDRSPHPGFLENGPGSRWKIIPSVSWRQVLGRSSCQDGFRKEVLPQRHFGSRVHSKCGGCSRSGAGLYAPRRTLSQGSDVVRSPPPGVDEGSYQGQSVRAPSQICHNLSLTKQHAVCAASTRGESHLRKLTLCRVPNHSF